MLAGAPPTRGLGSLVPTRKSRVSGTSAGMTAAASGMRVIGHSDLGGSGDTMHVAFYGRYAYVGHMGDDRIGTSVVDISDPRHPHLVRQLETPAGTHSHKTEVVDGLLLVNYERNPREAGTETWEAGLKIFDIATDPENPRAIGFLPIGGVGVHRMTCLETPFVYMSAAPAGFTNKIFVVADISDPTAPQVVSRWWLPGTHRAAGEELPAWADGLTLMSHHTLVDGDRAYCAWWDGGVVALDLADRAEPTFAWRWRSERARHTHTAMPIPSRSLLVVTEEATGKSPPGWQHDVWLVDISAPDSPRPLTTLPHPAGRDPCPPPWRFGPHNLHEVRPQTGTLVDDDRIFVTFFAGGVRVFDIADPTSPRETAYCIPAAPRGQPFIQCNDLAVREDGLVYTTDRAGSGLYVIEQL